MFEQIFNPLIIILILVSILNFFTNHILDGIVILSIVIINTTIGFYQEYKSRLAVKSLAKSVPNIIKVIREKEYREIPSTDIVPGDIVILEEGDRVCADGRLFNINDLRVDESALTGESIPVAKVDIALPSETVLSDLKNMAFAGTIVTSGNSHLLATNTGFDTEFGKIAKSLEEEDTPKTTLEIQIELITKIIIKVVLIVIILIFFIAIIRNYGWLDSISISTALAVSAIPEGLPAIITITLAIGVNDLLKKRALIQNLESVETLGQISLIASDKTGTLTENELTVTGLIIGNDEYGLTGNGYNPNGELINLENNSKITPNQLTKSFLKFGLLCNNAKLVYEADQNSGWKIIGDPTEGALIVAGEKLGLEHDILVTQYKKIDEIPFSTKHRLMATLHKKDQDKFLIVKGAPEVIIPKISSEFSNNKKIILKDKEHLSEKFEKYANTGYRVLALATKKIQKDTISNSDLNNLQFVGFYIMEDVPRKGVVQSIAQAYKAGIRVIMITGDHPSTARAIGQQINLKNSNEVLIGSELVKFSDEELSEKIKSCNIYARIAPLEKLRIVKILQKQKEVVAVTGDGINDAPSIKAANIGIAMGKKGTTVSKEVASLVLLDDHFTTIVTAIKSGRTIYQNIKRVLYYLLSTSLGEIFIIGFALIFGLPLPLTAIQILWINLITDTANAIPLIYEPAHEDLMQRPPRQKNQKFFSSPLLVRMVLVGLTMALACLPLFIYYAKTDVVNARSFAFAVATITQLFNVINAQNFNNSIFKLLWTKNIWPITIASISAIVLYLGIEVSFFQKIFGTVGLTTNQWFIAFLVSFSVILVIEIDKFLSKDKNKI